ncbi:MAG TPA: tRNA (adenine(22)-N(1))-methyltransferase TrmK [Candidatus Deferrimicrobium sp.]|nr:tRNA (adenine(22)-N(1))-methyltransferase TrmK [Candidatus Deferrimicrobium sp.]
MRPALSPRLRSLVALVPAGAAGVADVGAGHGALCAGLAARTDARLIATEVCAGPLRELRDNLAAWGLIDRVEVRCGPGLDPLATAEVDAVVVAGVGATTMLNIARDAPARGVRWLILQCMQHDELVLPWLTKRGWPVRATDTSRHRQRAYIARLVEVEAGR